MDSKAFIDELEAALAEPGGDRAGKMIGAIDPTPFDDADAETVANLLRRKRHPYLLERATAAFADTLPENVTLKRQRAQALIELKRIPQALALLTRLLQDGIDSPRERSEVRGLIGRAHKQTFVDQTSDDALRLAVDAYSRGWKDREGDYRWHGINLVALAARARREGIELPEAPDITALAREIIVEIESRERDNAATVWDYATAFESALALDDPARMRTWLKRYIRHPGADAFELNSTLRQLREIWRLEGTTPPGERIIPLFEHAILARGGGNVEVVDTHIPGTAATLFEAVYGAEGGVYLAWLKNLMSRLDAVARIANRATGEPVGTGFVIEGGRLADALAGDTLFVTNAHVVSEQAIDQAPLNGEEAHAEFTTLAKRPAVPLGRQVFYSPRTELDISVVTTQRIVTQTL